MMICRDKSRYAPGNPNRILPGTVRTCPLRPSLATSRRPHGLLTVLAEFWDSFTALPRVAVFHRESLRSHWFLPIAFNFKDLRPESQYLINVQGKVSRILTTSGPRRRVQVVAHGRGHRMIRAEVGAAAESGECSRRSRLRPFAELISAPVIHMAGTALHSRSCRPSKARARRFPQPPWRFTAVVHRFAGFMHMAIHSPREVACSFLGSAYESSMRRAGAQVWVGVGAARRSLWAERAALRSLSAYRHAAGSSWTSSC